jgi:hypothetical protein
MLDVEHIGSEYMKLNPSEEKIITTLALEGFKTYYDFFKDGAMSSSTAWNLTRKLCEQKLIEVKKEEAFRIRGRPKKLYGLTFRGLIASLKLEGVKLGQVRNREELASSWVRTIEEFDSILGISEPFKKLDGMSLNDRLRYFENQLILYMREEPEEAEDFFRHYDLDNSEDSLIFNELTWHVSLYLQSKSYHISREQRRKLKSLGRFKKLEGAKS